MAGFFYAQDDEYIPRARAPTPPPTHDNSAVQGINQSPGPELARPRCPPQPSGLIFCLAKIPYSGPTQRTGKHLPHPRRAIWRLHGDKYCEEEPGPDGESVYTPLVDCNIVLENGMYYIKGMFARRNMTLAPGMEENIRQFPLWHLATTKSSRLFLIDLAHDLSVVKLSRDGDAWQEWEFHVTAYNHIKLRWDMVMSCVGDHVARVRVARPGGRVGHPKEAGSSEKPTGKCPFRPDMMGYLMEHISRMPLHYEGVDGMVKPMVKLGKLRLEKERHVSRSGRTSLYLDEIWNKEILPINSCAAQMGAVLAILHWSCLIDARDVEFQMAPCGTGTELWVTDFGDCKSIKLRDSYVKTCLVDAALENYSWPRPREAFSLLNFDVPGGVAQQIWSTFKETYMVVSSNILNNSKATDVEKSLPATFVEEFERRCITETHEFDDSDDEDAHDDDDVRCREYNGVADHINESVDEPDDSVNGSGNAAETSDTVAQKPDGSSDELDDTITKSKPIRGMAEMMHEEWMNLLKPKEEVPVHGPSEFDANETLEEWMNLMKPKNKEEEVVHVPSDSDDTFDGLGPIGGMSSEALDELMEPRKGVLLPPDHRTFGDEDIEMMDVDEPVDGHDQPGLMDETPDEEGTLVAKSHINMDHIKEYDSTESDNVAIEHDDSEYDEYEVAEPKVSRKPVPPEWFPKPKTGSAYKFDTTTNKTDSQSEKESPLNLDDPIDVDQSMSDGADQNVQDENEKDTGDELGQDGLDEIDDLFK